jgi:uncharacterized membrane protein YqaE (UPF0057 family)
MLYLIAIFLPPVACLLVGKPFQALINLILTIGCLWIGGVIHACMLVADYKAEQRMGRLARGLRR